MLEARLMMGRKERSSPRPKKELLDQASSVETKEIRCQMPGPMDRSSLGVTSPSFLVQDLTDNRL